MAALLTSERAAHFSELIESVFTASTAEQQEKAEADGMSEQCILVARALRGDQDAFDDIFDRYSGLMLRTAYGIVQDRDSAEDAVQNALVQAWQHLPSLRETGALHPWLLRIVVNQCISFKRRLARSTMFLCQSFSEQEAYLASQVADDARGSYGAQLGSRACSRAIACEAAKCHHPPLLSRNDAPSNISKVADFREHPQKAYTDSAEQSAPGVEGR